MTINHPYNSLLFTLRDGDIQKRMESLNIGNLYLKNDLDYMQNILEIAIKERSSIQVENIGLFLSQQKDILKLDFSCLKTAFNQSQKMQKKHASIIVQNIVKYDPNQFAYWQPYFQEKIAKKNLRFNEQLEILGYLGRYENSEKYFQLVSQSVVLEEDSRYSTSNFSRFFEIFFSSTYQNKHEFIIDYYKRNITNEYKYLILTILKKSLHPDLFKFVLEEINFQTDERITTRLMNVLFLLTEKYTYYQLPSNVLNDFLLFNKFIVDDIPLYIPDLLRILSIDFRRNNKSKIEKFKIEIKNCLQNFLNLDIHAAFESIETIALLINFMTNLDIRDDDLIFELFSITLSFGKSRSRVVVQCLIYFIKFKITWIKTFVMQTYFSCIDKDTYDPPDYQKYFIEYFLMLPAENRNIYLKILIKHYPNHLCSYLPLVYMSNDIKIIKSYMIKTYTFSDKDISDIIRYLENFDKSLLEQIYIELLQDNYMDPRITNIFGNVLGNDRIFDLLFSELESQKKLFSSKYLNLFFVLECQKSINYILNLDISLANNSFTYSNPFRDGLKLNEFKDYVYQNLMRVETNEFDNKYSYALNYLEELNFPEYDKLLLKLCANEGNWSYVISKLEKRNLSPFTEFLLRNFDYLFSSSYCKKSLNEIGTREDCPRIIKLKFIAQELSK